VDLRDGARLRGVELTNIDLSGARLRNVDLTGARVMEANLVNARFSGLIIGLVVNDVEVAPLITAEMDRRYPERRALRPADADGVRVAWSVIESLWTDTKERAAALDEVTLHERVDGEWSFVETLRHLIFVTDAWISGIVLGRTGQFHEIGVAPAFIDDPGKLGVDTEADPPFPEVVAVREARMGTVRDLIAGITDEALHRRCGDQTVSSCLCTLFDEEWHHNWYANRDLDKLATNA
jgi:DinB superfamily/Pentapeptide repeats (8 copies)